MSEPMSVGDCREMMKDYVQSKVFYTAIAVIVLCFGSMFVYEIALVKSTAVADARRSAILETISQIQSTQKSFQIDRRELQRVQRELARIVGTLGTVIDFKYEMLQGEMKVIREQGINNKKQMQGYETRERDERHERTGTQ